MTRSIITAEDLGYKQECAIQSVLQVEMLDSYGKDKVSIFEFITVFNEKKLDKVIERALIEDYSFLGKVDVDISASEIYKIYEKVF